jgi:hypothetical protein
MISLAWTTVAVPVFAQTYTWGELGDVPVPGDYDGDGISDYAVWRPSSGYWYIIDSSTQAYVYRQWGAPTDRPVYGDFDGDGKTDIAVWRPSTGYWYIITSSTGAIVTRQWGAATDIPVSGDFDGDGKADIAVWRPSTGYWYIIESRTGAIVTRQWGAPTDVPVAGDFDGDGKTDIAVWRSSTGYWYIIQSSNDQVIAKQWGAPTDVPVVGDYDGDGKADIAVWRPSTAYWYIIDSALDQVVTQQWGDAGDIPVQDRYAGGPQYELATWHSTDGIWSSATAPPPTCVPLGGASSCRVTIYSGGQPYGGLTGPTPGTITTTQTQNGDTSTSINSQNHLGVTIYNNVNGPPLKTPACIVGTPGCPSLTYHSFEICAIDGKFRPVTYKSVVSTQIPLTSGCTGSPYVTNITTGYSLSSEGILTGTDTSTDSQDYTCAASSSTSMIQDAKHDSISLNLNDGSGNALISESRLSVYTNSLSPNQNFTETTSVTGSQAWPPEAVSPPQFAGTGVSAQTMVIPAGGAMPQACLVGTSDGVQSQPALVSRAPATTP